MTINIKDAREVRSLLRRKNERDMQIDPLMAKMEEANRLGFQLTEADKRRLLALLLDDVLDGTI